MSTAVAVVEKKDAAKKGTSLKQKDAALTPEVLTDEFGDLAAIAVADVVEKAKALHNQVAGGMRYVAERQKALIYDYFEFGRLCAFLFKKVDRGNWQATCDNIGVSKSHADTAKKFYGSTTLEKLVLYRSKTAALRDLGLLPPKPEKPKSSSPPALVKPKSPKAKLPEVWVQPVVKAIRWIEKTERFNEHDLEALEALAAKIAEVRAAILAKA